MIPVIIKILAVFCLILVLNRARLQLSLSLFIGAMVLGFWMGMAPLELIHSAFASATRLQTVSLFLVVALVLLMSRIMEETGQMDRLVERFQRLAHDARSVGAVMPALMGLLPMPGGALFSAPMVEAAIPGNHIAPEIKSAINYWFRHLWEYWWPLYPGVILAIALLEVETWHFMAIMAPMSAAAITAGYFFILKPIGKMEIQHQGRISWRDLKGFLWEIMPIMIVILGIMLVSLLRGVLGIMGIRFRLPSAISILPGLVVATLWVFIVSKASFGRLLSALKNRKLINMLILVLAIMIFKGIMADSQAVTFVRDELLHTGIPLVLIVLIMPLMSGIVTGIAIGFVGTSFPLIIPLFPGGDHLSYLSFAALAYTFGCLGMLLSPVHLCLLMTKDFFKATFLGSYRHFFKAVIVVMISALLLYSLTSLL